MMRALTLTQPYAGLVASGIKRVENRPRKMINARDFGKRFAIHASREIDESVYHRIRELAPELFAIDDSSLTDEQLALGIDPHQPWWYLSRVTSAIIAVATLADALYIGGTLPGVVEHGLDRVFGGPGHNQARWTFGPTCYLLSDVVALAEPVPCRGWQGFWCVAEDIEARVLAQLAA